VSKYEIKISSFAAISQDAVTLLAKPEVALFAYDALGRQEWLIKLRVEYID